jgi:hypothetical protein
MKSIYILTWLLVALVVFWLGYHFVVGFVQGFKEGWRRKLTYKRWNVWRLWRREYFDRDL